MAFSIPQSIFPNYSTAQVAAHAAGMPNVGSAIKDHPPGTETSMKKAHNIRVVKVNEQFVSDTERYDNNLRRATSRAEVAEKEIGQARFKKVIAITALVATIIGIIGTAIATAITGTLPLLFIAVPLVIALVPASYYTHIFRISVDALDDDIAAPKNLIRPTLQLPEYRSSCDLELKQSREDALSSMASKTTLQQVVQAKYSPDEITRYALLDRLTPIKSDKRPAFYARCIQLINAYGTIVNERAEYHDKVSREYKKLDSELHKWKSTEDGHISTQERALRDRELADAQGHHKPVTVGKFVHQMNTLFTRQDLDNKKAEVAHSYAKRSSENLNWKTQTIQHIDTAFDQAVSFLEGQFTTAKLAAA